MKATFALALYAGITTARRLGRGLTDDPKFIQYVSNYNKGYTSNRELQKRA